MNLFGIKAICFAFILILTIPIFNADQSNDDVAEDFKEYSANVTYVPPNQDLYKDSDGDGLSDLKESWWLCDQNDSDTNNDGILDGDSVNFFSENKTWPYLEEEIDRNNDTDGDGLPNLAEMYDIGTSFKSFSTDGDPYGDGEEYFNINMPKISPADHPLVAAYPDLSVGLIRVNVKPIKEIVTTAGRSKQEAWDITTEGSHSASNSFSFGFDETVSAQYEFGLFGGATIGGEFSAHQAWESGDTWTTTTATSNSGWNQSDWSTSTTENTDKAAYLGFALNVKNSGTVTAFEVEPNINIKLGDKLIATITSPTTISSIDIDKTSNQFMVSQSIVGGSSEPITVSLEQLMFIDAGTPLSIETLQVNAQIKQWDENDNQWILMDASAYINEIDRRSATLMFEPSSGVYKEYKVFADSEISPMTLSNAFNLTIGRDEVPIQTNQKWVFGFSEGAFNEARKLLDNNESIYDLKLRPGWKILIKARSDKPEPEISWAGYSEDMKEIFASVTDDLKVESVVAHVKIGGTFKDLNMTDDDEDTVYTLQSDQAFERDSDNFIKAWDIENNTAIMAMLEADHPEPQPDLFSQLWYQDLGIGGGSELGDKFGSSVASGDFNNDGYDDLAIGVEGEAIGTKSGAGAANVLYGSSGGLNKEGSQVWYQDLGIGGSSETDDYFGSSVASADFNNDGYDDLAIGVEGEAIGNKSGAGAVNILYGSSDGFKKVDSQVWYQDLGIGGGSEPGDKFGCSVASGDFNNDGYDDLAIGVEGEAIGTKSGAGAANVLYGSSSGLNKEGSQVWYQDLGIGGGSEPGDKFGCSVGSGDFNNDGYDDLAIGVEGEAIGNKSGAGAVNILCGSSSGLNKEGSQVWYQDLGIGGSSETDDYFGSSIVSGDFNNDGYDDLAIGVEGEAISTKSGAGAVNILYGSSGGLNKEGSQVWYQDLGIGGSSEPQDRFGSSVASGDFNNDTYDDLAIGVPGEGGEGPGEFGEGAVNVLFGSSGGLKIEGYQLWYQDLGIGGNSTPQDFFGCSVASGDFNNDSYDDLAIGVEGETIGNNYGAGAVNVLYDMRNTYSR